MKLVYQAKDGSIWTTEKDCVTRDKLYNDVCIIHLMFNRNVNGENFVQISQHEVDSYILDVYKLLKYNDDDWRAEQWLKNPRGIIGRMWDDANSPFAKLYWLLQRVDKKNRMWQQPYFAYKANDEISENGN